MFYDVFVLYVISCLVILYFSFFFFLMIRRPPRSTLFPTRRSSDLYGRVRALFDENGQQVAQAPPSMPVVVRSEEHTSELQSRLHLVCRLLLEKKKQSKPHHWNSWRGNHRVHADVCDYAMIDTC